MKRTKMPHSRNGARRLKRPWQQPMTRLGAIMLIEHVIQIEKSDLPDSVMALLDRLHAFLACSLNSPSAFGSALSA